MISIKISVAVHLLIINNLTFVSPIINLFPANTNFLKTISLEEVATLNSCSLS